MSKIKLPARIEYLEALIQFVSAYAREKGFTHERITQVELATEEALVNIFKYAYPEDIGEVELTCKMDNDKFIIKIVDTGVPFDIESVPEPDLAADISDRKIGGLGIFIIRKMVDELQYRREDNKNILIFILYQRKEK
jgi:serine/threonine-protein kinase RsbW